MPDIDVLAVSFTKNEIQRNGIRNNHINNTWAIHINTNYDNDNWNMTINKNDLVIGIIGMGDMGKMYCKMFEKAGWKYVDVFEMNDNLID